MWNNKKTTKNCFPLCQIYKPTIIFNWNSPVEYPSRECKHYIKESKGNMFNPIFKENV